MKRNGKINIRLLFILCELVFFLVILSKILSPQNRRRPPDNTPRETINHEINLRFSAISKAGESKLQNVAASITPADNPSIASMVFLFTFLNKNTTAAPRDVIPHVNNDAIKAWMG